MPQGKKTFSFIVGCLALLGSLLFAGYASADLLTYRCENSVSDDICILDPDNTATHQDLTETEYDENQPTWSPDGKKISFIGGYPGKNGLYATDPSQPGTGTEVLEGGGSYAAWSPDGAWIAAEEHESKTNEQYAVVFPSDGTGTPHRVGLENVSELHPTWSADSRSIAFTHSNAIYVAPADGSGEAKALLGGIGNEIAWSPDGSSIAGISATDYVVRIIAANGSGSTVTLPVKARLGSSIAWSPDSKLVTYVSEGGQVWVAPANGENAGHEVPLPTGAIVPLEPAISPDGTRVAFSAEGTSENQQIYVGPTDGSRDAVKLTEGVWGSMEPDWRPGPGAVKGPPPGEEHKSGEEKSTPPTIKFAEYHHPKVYGDGLTGVYVDCSLGPTSNAACVDRGEGSTYAQPQGVRPRPYARAKPKKVVVVKGSVKVPNGKKKELPLRLTPAGRKLLKTGRTLKIKLTITQAAAGFKTVTTSKTITVKSPAHRH